MASGAPITALGFVKLAASGGLFVALLATTADALSVAGQARASFMPEAAASQALGRTRPPDGSPAGPGTLEPLAARGQALFQAKGCVACHTVAGVPGNAQVGPNLTGLPAVAGTRKPGMPAADYVRESLVEPQAYVVPGYGSRPNDPGAPAMPKLALTPPEVEALVAFLLSPHGT